MLGLPRAYWFLWAGTLVNRVGSFVLVFLAIYLTEARGFSPAAAGGVVALAGAGMLVAALLGGVLTDRLGRRPTLLASMTLGAAAMLALGWARTPTAIAGAAFATGLFGDLYRPASQAIIADIVAPPDRIRAYGVLYWAVNLGASTAAVLAGALAKHDFALLFFGDAATSLACGAIVWFGLAETRPQAATHASPLRGLTRPLSDLLFLRFLAAQLLLGLIFFQFGVALPLDMRAHGISTAGYGRLIALNGLLVVLLQPLGVRLSERAAPARVLALGALLVGLGYGATALTRTPLGYAATIVVWTCGEIAWSGMSLAVVATLAPADLRGTYQGVYMMMWALAFLLAPALGGTALHAFGASALWAGCLVLGLVSAALHLVFLSGLAREPAPTTLP